MQVAQAFAGLDSSHTSIDAARFVILPVPYEATTEWLSGTRHAPDRIIESSRLLELYDHELNRDISRAGIATAPAIQPVLSGPESMVARVKDEVSHWLSRGKIPVLLGGEHTITLGAVQAMRAKYADLSVLHLDAHADLRDEYFGARCSQATVMRRVRELCPAAQMGVRAISEAERTYVDENRLPVVFWPPTSDCWIEDVLEALSNTVYVTIDADVFDSAILPSVGTPEPDGPGWQDVWSLLRAVAGSRHIAGFDVVELAPEGRLGDVCAYTLAKLIYRLIGYIQMHNEQREASNSGRISDNDQREASNHG